MNSFAGLVICWCDLNVLCASWNLLDFPPCEQSYALEKRISWWYCVQTVPVSCMRVCTVSSPVPPSVWCVTPRTSFPCPHSIVSRGVSALSLPIMQHRCYWEYLTRFRVIFLMQMHMVIVPVFDGQLVWYIWVSFALSRYMKFSAWAVPQKRVQFAVRALAVTRRVEMLLPAGRAPS